jgi:hypothetical protein
VLSVSDLIGYNSVITLFKREKYQTYNWNPVHYAIYRQSLTLVKKFLEESYENIRLATRQRDSG